uniref:C2H2-type domain-containing protein n=1 Tax=Oryza meridionalis TaxID=40149 RepID=A0A0E0C8M7_9ORYZ
MGERRRRASAVAGGRAEDEKAASAPAAAAPAPTVWFALKRSLHCRSEPSEVHVPRPKAVAAAAAGGAGHLSAIVTKRAAPRSGCSRSIANLRDVIHGSKRHPERPPSCSPRSIGSSEFLNPIAHEVVLSTNSRCELKITGFGGCGGLAAAAAGGGVLASPHEADGDGAVVSSFVGTLRPGTPGPGWSHGLQYSGSCRGSMRCTPPRSPNVLLDSRDAAAAGVTAHRASCEDAVKSGGKGGGGGGGGLSCHRCGEQFSKWEALEAHHLSKHAVTELVEGDSSRKIVEIICRTSLLKSESSCVRIERVFKVHNTQRTLARFEEYREAVKLKASKLPKKHPRCLADGNELLRFHGATLSCALGGSAGSSSLCASNKCAVCRIIRHGFSAKKEGKAGVGVFTTSTSGRAYESIEASTGAVVGGDDPAATRKALLVCRVIAGRVHKPLENLKEFAGQTGFDSLAGKVGPYSNIEELYLLNPRALLPCFVVICKA